MATYMKIKQAAHETGLSKFYLREGCKMGTVPHIKNGSVYLINVPALLRKLDTESGGKYEQCCQ